MTETAWCLHGCQDPITGATLDDLKLAIIHHERECPRKHRPIISKSPTVYQATIEGKSIRWS